MEAGLSADRPTVLDIRCDPDVPPIPPHSTFEQFKSTVAAFLHGDEDRWGFAKQGIKEKAQELLPGRKSTSDED
jgi:pyruvate dehydrogenase (quinone)